MFYNPSISNRSQTAIQENAIKTHGKTSQTLVQPNITIGHYYDIRLNGYDFCMTEK